MGLLQASFEYIIYIYTIESEQIINDGLVHNTTKQYR